MNTSNMTRSPIDNATESDNYSIKNGFLTGPYSGFRTEVDNVIFNNLSMWDGYDVPEEENVYDLYMQSLNV